VEHPGVSRLIILDVGSCRKEIKTDLSVKIEVECEEDLSTLL
jgi:hypothetical protein